jgi:hypothetical protein
MRLTLKRTVGTDTDVYVARPAATDDLAPL